MHRSYASVALAAVLMSLSATAARAQGFAVRGGANVNPDQMSLGGQYETRLVEPAVWLQPNVDAGFGNGATLIAVNVDATYRHPLGRRSPWAGFIGGGPAVNWYRFPAYSQREPGVNIVAGLRHRDGVFTEVRLGWFESPQFRLGVGYRFVPRAQPAKPARKRR